MSAESHIHDALQEVGRVAQAQQPPEMIVEEALRRINSPHGTRGSSWGIPSPGWRPKRIGWIATSVGAAALCAGFAISAFSPSGDGGVAQAATVLRDVAKVAATRAQAPPWVAGSFYYQDTIVHFGSLDQHREEWTATNGETFYRFQDRSKEGNDRWHRGTTPSEDGNLLPFGFGAEGLTYRQLQALPTDPDALEARMKAAAIPFGERPQRDELFSMVGNVLREVAAPPEVRAAFYRVAAHIPGIVLLGETKDSLGRTGVAVAIDQRIEGSGDQREVMVFDPETSELLEERRVAVSTVRECDGGSPRSGGQEECETYEPGQTIGFTTTAHSGVVEHPFQQP